jgi:hypothetical protein
MLALILAASLSLEQVLPKFEDFCTKAELEIAHPLTEQMLTKQAVNEKHDQVVVRVQDRYVLKYLLGRVKSFTDLHENVAVRLTRLDPEDMKRWSEQPCLLDEATAGEIAKRIFERLGFDEKEFDPPEVHHFRWQPSPADPENVLWLPVFMAKWYQKGESRDQALPPHVEMDISCATKKLVYYLDATTKKRFSLRPAPAASNLIPTNAVALPLSENIATECAQFAKAAGLDLADTWQQQTKVVGTGSSAQSVGVGENYLFELRNDRIEKFSDHEKLLRQFPEEKLYFDEVKQWVGKPSVITETQAMAIATQVFQRLGFDSRQFYPAYIKRMDSQVEDPEHPGVALSLPPSYMIRWASKRPFWARNGSPEMVFMEISGTTSNLIFYLHSPNTFRFWPW